MKAPAFDRALATQFLRWRYEDDLSAALVLGFTEGIHIPPGGPDRFDEIVARAERERQHLFFHVATLKPEWADPANHDTGKVTTASKKHVLECPFLWLDIDPEKYTGNDPAEAAAHYAAELRRLDTIVGAKLTELDIKPCALGVSGGGLQGLVRLTHAILPTEAEELDRRLHLAIEGRGTEASNCNRILRVPGSINWKDKWKCKTPGRPPMLAAPCKLSSAIVKVEHVREVLANIEAPPPRAGGRREGVDIDFDTVSDLINTFTIDKLRERGVEEHALISLEFGDNITKLHERHKAIGHRVSEGPYSGYGAVLFAIAGALNRAGLSPEETAAVLLTGSFGGTKHLRKFKTAQHVRRAVIRVIGRARSLSLAQQQRQAIGAPEWRDYDGKTGLLPRPTMANAVIGIKALGVSCRKDLFHERILLEYGGSSVELANLIGEVTDECLYRIRSLINNKWKFDLGAQCIFDGVTEIALDNAFDPIRDYLDECQSKWDGQDRLDKAAVTYFNAEDTALNCAIISTTLIGSVRRARQPGSKFDTITVLESEEGFNKSSAIRVMYGKENFSDQTILGVDDRKTQEQLGGVWGYECADLSGLPRAEIERVKAFASRQIDSARPAYGRTMKHQPRRCVFWGSTNNNEYLQSQTGNRRFWPMRVMRSIDLDNLKQDRDQLWAEAAVRESKIPHETDINIPASLWGAAGAAQEERRVVDPWEDILRNMPESIGTENGEQLTIIQRTGAPTWELRVKSQTLLERVLFIPRASQNDIHGKRLATCMRLLGWPYLESKAAETEPAE